MLQKQETRSAKVIALSLGQTLTTLVLLILGMVATRMLTKADYATMRQTMLAYNFVAPLLMLGLPNALYYFLPRSENRKKAITLENMLLLGILALIFSLFLLLGGYKFLALRFNNPLLEHTLQWTIAYPLYMMPVSILAAVLVINQRTTLLATYNVGTNLLILIGAIIGLYLTHSYTGPLYAQIFIPILFFPLALHLIFKYTPGQLSPLRTDSMKEMLKYSAPLGFATMLGTIMLQLDKVIVSWMCQPDAFANYVNGAMEIPLISVITGSISTVLLSDMSSMCYNNRKDEAIKLFHKATLYSASILLPVMLFFFLTAKPFIVFLYSAKYVESVTPFVIFLLVIPIRTVMYGSALMAIGKSKQILYRSFFDLLVNLILSVILIHFFGYLGAAVATVLTLYLWTVPYNLYHIGKGFDINPLKVLPLPEMAKILAWSTLPLLPAAVYLLFPQLPSYIQVGIAAIIYFPLTFLILYKLNYLYIPEKFEKLIPVFLKRK